MMFNDQPLPPAAATADESRAFFALLTLVTDPKASAQRVAELHEAASKTVEAQAELKAARDAHDAAIRSERAEHDAKLKAERSALVAERAAFETERRNWLNHCSEENDKIRRNREQAAADAKRAAEKNEDLERRISLIRSAGV